MRKSKFKQGIVRLTSISIIVSLIANGIYVSNIAHANDLYVDLCTPTVASPTGPGITNFTIGSINNTTAVRPGGVAYSDYTNSFTPPLATKNGTIPFSRTYTSIGAGFGSTTFILDDGFIVGNHTFNLVAGTNTDNSVASFQDSINLQKTGIVTIRTSVSSGALPDYQVCSASDGEIEDYRIVLQGTTPSVNLYHSNESTFVREGGRTETVDVQLDTKPTQNVTVNLTAGSRFTLSNSSFTFTPTNWYVHQPVTVTAVDDGLSNGQVVQTISYSTSSSDAGYSGLAGSPLSVQVMDNDSADDSSIEIHLFSTSTENNSGPDVSKVSGITSFGEFTADNFFGPTDNTDVITPIARRYNFNNSSTSFISMDVDAELTTLTSPTVLALADDELTPDITLPFDVMMYGQVMKKIQISSNGIIYLAPTSIQTDDNGNAVPYDGNAAIDLTGEHILFTSNAMMIAALWSDLSPASGGGAGTISYGVEGVSPNRQFVIYYNGVAPYDGTGGVNTVQVKLHETALNPSGDVDVTANVDPVISYTLDTTNCNFGALTSATVKTCVINLVIATNASSGYTAYIRDVNNGLLISGTDNINAVVGTSLNAGTEGFGVSTSVGSQDLIQEPDCSDASLPINVESITTANQSFSGATAPVLSDSIDLCMAVSITDTTPAGSYSNTAYITVVGNF